MRTKIGISNRLGMRTTLELPDPLFARLKARACSERVSLKQLLPRLEGALASEGEPLSNAALFELLDT